MTRFLSESLQAREPNFNLELRKLELSHGSPGHDINLSTMTQQAAYAKMSDLGLDPHDTTGKELYLTLLERVRADDARLVKALRTRAAKHVSAEADVVAGMVHALREAPLAKSSLTLKSSRLKTLIKNSLRKRP